METVKNILSLVHHRSKKRIRDFGEVFTPEKYVNQMLDMLDKSVWTGTNTVFFEPTCGHGNFVEAIVERRLKALFQKAKKEKVKKPQFYAVANTLNNLWAIDIDSQNIEFCRNRVWSLNFNFLWEYEKNTLSLKTFIKNNIDFLTHLLCCIEWQIHENEALSCLETNSFKAKEVADKTAVSRKWLKKNKHRPINFKIPWCEYFKSMTQEKITPLEYMKNYKYLNSRIDSKEEYKEKEAVLIFEKSTHFNSNILLKTS